jgi:hypothetical protein
MSKGSQSLQLSPAQHRLHQVEQQQNNGGHSLFDPAFRAKVQVHNISISPPSIPSIPQPTSLLPPIPRPACATSATASLMRQIPNRIATSASLSHLSRARPEHNNTVNCQLGLSFTTRLSVSHARLRRHQLPRLGLHSPVIAKASYSQLLAPAPTVASSHPLALQKSKTDVVGLLSRPATGGRELHDPKG